MLRNEAEKVYLLTPADVRALPAVSFPREIFVLRAQAEALALQRYGSVEALMQAKQERRRIAEAEFSYKKAMNEAKIKAAKACGVQAPSHLQKPPIFYEPVTLDWTKVNSNAGYDSYWSRRHALLPLPFPAKHDPTVNAITGEPADAHFICRYCKGRLDHSECDAHLRRYPSAALRDSHELTCRHRHG